MEKGYSGISNYWVDSELMDTYELVSLLVIDKYDD